MSRHREVRSILGGALRGPPRRRARHSPGCAASTMASRAGLRPGRAMPRRIPTPAELTPPSSIQRGRPSRCPWSGRSPIDGHLFDDPSVVHAIRQVASLPHVRAVTTLTVDAVHFAGSLLVTNQAMVEAWPGWWSVDPFARLGSRRRMLVEGGLLGDHGAVLGPGTQRRAGAPWPAHW